MSTRKIKNARDLESNELIYFKSHAQATFMSDGSTVEDVINDIKGNGGGDLSNYVTTEQLNTSLSGKQDKLVSSTNIKTINGESILGSGDIEISSGGSSDANVQAVDTGDVIDDVTVEYATKAYVDGLVGDINSVLESIINS